MRFRPSVYRWVSVPLLLLVFSSEGLPQTDGRRPQEIDSIASSCMPATLFESSRGVTGIVEPKARVQPRQPRDTLANGVIIGAIAGAIALGAFAAVLCKAQQEPGGPSCVSDTVRIAAVGAAIGAGGGLIVDAALSRQPGVSVSISVRF